MNAHDLEAELARIAALPPLERAAAAEELEGRLRGALDQVSPDQPPA